MSNEINEILEERINPVRVTDNETSKVYELDFSRESVKFAENRGFAVDEITKFPVTRIPELFYFAFRKNHKNVARSQTDALLDDMGGLSAKVLERLMQLYNQAALTHMISSDEDAEKNTKVTVEL